MQEKISGVYKIENTITGEFYIGSSKDVKRRWRYHKSPSSWKHSPNSLMYYDMQKYGTDSFEFQILEEVEPEQLKETEQQFIETLKPTYNNYNAKGLDVKRCEEYKKEYMKEYSKSDKYKEYQKEYQKEYEKSDKRKEYMKEYRKSDKYKEYQKEYMKEYSKSDKYKEYQKEYNNQLCSYNGGTISLGALAKRFQRAGIEHPTLEAKKYLIKN